MIILDTNVISELMCKRPNPALLNWSRANSEQSLAITTLTIFEILRGIERLPESTKRARLETAFKTFLDYAFAETILDFDKDAARQTAFLCRLREQNGHHIHKMDMMIAGIAKSTSAQIATRNIKDFSHCNLELINPWGAKMS